MPGFVFLGGMHDEMSERDLCLRKAQEYWVKAQETDHLTMKGNLEAIARELEYRAKQLKSRLGLCSTDQTPSVAFGD